MGFSMGEKPLISGDFQQSTLRKLLDIVSSNPEFLLKWIGTHAHMAASIR